MEEQKKCLDIERVLEQLQIPEERFAAWRAAHPASGAPARDANAAENRSLYPLFHWEMGRMEYIK